MRPTVAIGYNTQYEYPYKPDDLKNLDSDPIAKLAAERTNQTTLEDHLAGIQSPGAVIGGMVYKGSFSATLTGGVPNYYNLSPFGSVNQTIIMRSVVSASAGILGDILQMQYMYLGAPAGGNNYYTSGIRVASAGGGVVAQTQAGQGAFDIIPLTYHLYQNVIRIDFNHGSNFTFPQISVTATTQGVANNITFTHTGAVHTSFLFDSIRFITYNTTSISGHIYHWRT